MVDHSSSDETEEYGWEALSKNLGGVVHGLASCYTEDKRLCVFGIGTDHTVFWRFKKDGEWSEWEALGGSCKGGLACAAREDQISLAAISGANTGLCRVFKDGEWEDWHDMGGMIHHGPVLVWRDDDHCDMFCTGADNTLWVATWHDEAWSEWVSAGGCCFQHISCAANDHKSHCMVRGQNNALFECIWDGESAEWVERGGVIYDAPTAVKHDDKIWGIVNGSSNHTMFAHNSEEYTDLGGMSMHRAKACSTDDKLGVFCRDTTNKLCMNVLEDGEWSGWQNTGECVVSDFSVTKIGNGKVRIFFSGCNNEARLLKVKL